jgi:hemerythrin-like domain-containing protein
MLWAEFSDALEEHLRFEEEEIFPRFATNPVVAELLREHEHIRSAASELGTRLLSGDPTVERDLARLLDAVERHSELENRTVYELTAEDQGEN